MGIFKRMSNMLKAKANSTLDNMENPIEMLDQKIRDMEEQLTRANQGSAQVLANAKQLEKKLADAEALSADYDSKVRLALSKGNDELAKKALAKKVENDKKIESLKASYQNASNQAEAVKANVLALKDEIEKTKNYRDEAAARYANAQASKTVNEVLADVNTKSNSIQLDSIERKIAREEATAQGLGDLRGIDSSFDDEFEKLNTLDLDAELEKYR